MARRATRVRRENLEPVCSWWFSDAALREVADGVAAAERERTTPLPTKTQSHDDADGDGPDWESA